MAKKWGSYLKMKENSMKGERIMAKKPVTVMKPKKGGKKGCK